MLGAGARGDHHHRDIFSPRLLPQMRHQLVAVSARHLEIGHDQVAATLGGDLESLESIGRQFDAVACLFEHAPHELAYADGIIGQDDDFFVWHNINGLRRNGAMRHGGRSRSKNSGGGRMGGTGHQRAALDGFAHDQPVQINQQDEAAIGRDGGAGEQLDVAHVLAQVLDHDLVFADYFFHDDADLAAANIDDHQPVISIHRLHVLQTKLEIEADDFRHHIAHAGEQLAAHFFQVRVLQAADFFHEGQRESKHIFAAAHEQRLRNDEGERNLEREARTYTFLGFDLDLAIELVEVGADYVESHAAASQLGLARSR